MDINCLFESVTKKFAESIFDVSRETLNDATFWTNNVTSRNCFPVDGILITITQYCNSSMELSINCY